jgi:hypothetical protein
MSPAMKKPERVEVGQWWVTRFGGQAPDRVTPDAIAALCAFQSEMLHWIDARDYLGSGDHPEPSEWMIETLAEHLMTCGGSSKSAEPMLFDDVRLHVMAVLNGITSPFVGMESERDATRNVLSLYRILRSLGKW